MKSFVRWTPADDEILRKLWGYVSIAELAHFLNRTEKAVAVRHARLFALKKGRKGHTAKRWSPEDDQFLWNRYPVLGGKDTAEALGRTIHAVRCHYAVLYDRRKEARCSENAASVANSEPCPVVSAPSATN